MNTSFKTLLIGSIALGGAALATPAQAHGGHRHDGHWGGHHERVVTHFRSHSYYPDYSYGYAGPAFGYYDPYAPSYFGPSLTFGVGGYHYHHHRHWR